MGGDQLLSWRGIIGPKGRSGSLPNPEILGGGCTTPPIPPMHGPDVSLRRVKVGVREKIDYFMKNIFFKFVI